MNNNRCQQAMKLITKRHFRKLDISISEIARNTKVNKSLISKAAQQLMAE